MRDSNILSSFGLLISLYALSTHGKIPQDQAVGQATIVPDFAFTSFTATA
ncbi:hypothetical protein J5751_05470 [bacterium]|nr:hypothetical protein [bacterium]